MRILFLDVDGVLHPAATNNTVDSKPTKMFCDKQMRCLKQLVSETDANIVLSSAWRQHSTGIAAVNTALASYGMRHVFSCTPLSSRPRLEQIWSWLADHRTAVASYAIVDDSDLPGEAQQANANRSVLSACAFFVRTASAIGLDSTHVKRLSANLRKKPPLPSQIDVLHSRFQMEDNGHDNYMPSADREKVKGSTCILPKLSHHQFEKLPTRHAYDTRHCSIRLSHAPLTNEESTYTVVRRSQLDQMVVGHRRVRGCLADTLMSPAL